MDVLGLQGLSASELANKIREEKARSAKHKEDEEARLQREAELAPYRHLKLQQGTHLSRHAHSLC